MKTKQIDEKSDILEFILDSMQKENEAEIEYRTTHFSNGVKRYQYRTEEDRLENCGRLISMYVGTDGTQKERREYRCKLPSCKKCMDIRARERANDFSDRLDSVANEPLFYVKISTDREQKRLREWAYRTGRDYLCIPSDSSDKHVFINGPVKGSEPIHVEEAKGIAQRNASVIHLGKRINVSGKLGKKQKNGIAEQQSFGNTVNVMLREYVFNGKKPTKVEIQLADIKAMSYAIDIIDRSNGKITEDNIQEVFTCRENALFSVYKKMGFDIHYFDPVNKEIDIDAANKSWASIRIGKHEFIGNINGISPLSQIIVKQTVDRHNSNATPDSFSEEVDLSAKLMGL